LSYKTKRFQLQNETFDNTKQTVSQNPNLDVAELRHLCQDEVGFPNHRATFQGGADGKEALSRPPKEEVSPRVQRP